MTFRTHIEWQAQFVDEDHRIFKAAKLGEASVSYTRAGYTARVAVQVGGHGPKRWLRARLLHRFGVHRHCGRFGYSLRTCWAEFYDARRPS